MTYHVVVTAEDIAKGERYSANRCPVALALNRLVPDSSVGYGGDGYKAWIGDGWASSKPLPPIAQNFVGRFDQGLPVEPFDFTLGG